MTEMCKVSSNAVKWLNDHDTYDHWSQTYFREDKCDMLLNNLCESWNAAVLEARDKPILVGLEELKKIRWQG